MAALTSKQQNELDMAVLDYLLSNPSFSESAKTFASESGQSLPLELSEKKGILAKKWTAIMRLTKQVDELKRQIETIKRPGSATSEGVSTSRVGGGVGGGGLGGHQLNTGQSQRLGRMLPSTTSSGSMKGHSGKITCVRAHPNYSIVASCSEDTYIKLWDSESSKLVKTLSGHTRSVNSLKFDPSGNLLASCSSDLNIKLWSMETYVCLKTLSGHEDIVSNVVFMPSGDQILSCSKDQTIKVWETGSGYCVSTLSSQASEANSDKAGKSEDGWIRSIDVSGGDNNWLASGGDDNCVHLWQQLKHSKKSSEIWSHHCKLEHHQHHIQTLKFSPTGTDSSITARSSSDKRMLASAGRDSLIVVWEVSSELSTLSFILDYHNSWINDVIFHPDGKHILSCSDDRSIKVGDLSKQRCLRTIENAHGTDFVTSLAFSTPARKLVSSGVDKELRIWDCN